MGLTATLQSIHEVGVATTINWGELTILTFDVDPGPKRELTINGKHYAWITRPPSAGNDSQTGNQSRFTANMTDHDGNITRKEAVFGNGTLPPITTSVSQAPPDYEARGAFPSAPTDQITNTQQTDQSRPAFQVRSL